MPTATQDTRLRTLLLSRMEPLEPAATIAQYIKDHDGKKLTQRDIDKLNQLLGIKPQLDKPDPRELRLRKEFGTTNIVEYGVKSGWSGVGPGYSYTKGHTGHSFLIAYGIVGVTMDHAFFLNHNTCYLAAAVDRNKAREQALANIQPMEEALAEYGDLLNRLIACHKGISDKMGYGLPFSPDGIDIRREFRLDWLLPEGPPPERR